jgi:hypothetical protein
LIKIFLFIPEWSGKTGEELLYGMSSSTIQIK